DECAAALGGIAARPQVLGAEGAALRRRQAQLRAGGGGGIPAGIRWDGRVRIAAVLAPVGEARRRTLAGADVQGAVRPERRVIDCLRLLLVAPVAAADQDVLGADHLVVG